MLSILLAPIPLCLASALTKLGHVVDERVSLTVSVQISQLSAAVESQVVDAEPSLPCTAGVEQGTLGESERGNSHPSLTKTLATPPLCYFMKLEERWELSLLQPLLVLSVHPSPPSLWPT